VVSSSLFTRVRSVPFLGCTSSSAWTRAIAEYNGGVGYLISAAEGQRSVNLTDPRWRALIYVASQHGFSAPHLRLEAEDETLEVEESDAQGLRSVLGKALEARDPEEIMTPDGELDYDTIQRVRRVLRSEGARLACAGPRRISPWVRSYGPIHRSAWKAHTPKSARTRSLTYSSVPSLSARCSFSGALFGPPSCVAWSTSRRSSHV
jgi:hypothetical protein